MLYSIYEISSKRGNFELLTLSVVGGSAIVRNLFNWILNEGSPVVLGWGYDGVHLEDIGCLTGLVPGSAGGTVAEFEHNESWCDNCIGGKIWFPLQSSCGMENSYNVDLLPGNTLHAMEYIVDLVLYIVYSAEQDWIGKTLLQTCATIPSRPR